MAQLTYRKGDGVMVADESLSGFLAARGWTTGDAPKPAKKTTARKPRKPRTPKPAATQQTDSV